MAGVLDSVNQRTQMVGQNRLELLLFSLGGQQSYGINVFKVKEVLACPPLTRIPQRHPIVRGVAHIRGGTIAIMDLSKATGGPSLDSLENCFVIISEYNGSCQGFLVSSVDRIVNMNWADIYPPPREAGRETFLTAVTEVDGRLVEVIDVEKVLAEVSPPTETVSDAIIADAKSVAALNRSVLVVDDSLIARKQIQKVIHSLGIRTLLARDGSEALVLLEEMIASGRDPGAELLMIISDIEMPKMDGYTFTAAVRANAGMGHIHIILHTSLSGVFNEAMVKKVGADDFLAKFNPDELARRINGRLCV
jgi:two-component system chemotaxis response regulator CheV